MYLLTGGLVWQGAAEGFKQLDILVEGTKISRVVTSDHAPIDLTGVETIDATGRMIIPGFVNAHTHAAMTLLRSYADDLPLQEWLTTKIWPVEAGLDGDDVYWGTKLAIVEMIRAGVTTFADQYFFMDRVGEAVAASGVRAALALGMFDGDGWDAQFAEAKSLFRDWHGEADGRIHVMMGPHAPYSALRGMKLAAEAARELDIIVHIHLSETRREVAECMETHGVTPIALAAREGVLDAKVLAAHCVHVSEEDMQIMRDKGVGVAHNPTSNMKLGSGRAPVQAMLDAGILVALGTDGASSNNNLDMLEEARLAAFLAKMEEAPSALPAPVCLDMATVNGAQAMGLPDVGVLAPGYQADLVMIDMSGSHWQPPFDPCANLIYSASSRDVTDVMVAGRFLMRKGHMTELDEDKVIHEAARRGFELVAKESSSGVENK